MRRRRQNRPEQDLHRTVARFLSVALPTDAVFWHTPNGGGRSKAEAGIFKALGVKAGMPDLFILHGGHLHGIELKSESGRITVHQGDTIHRLSLAGCTTHVCRSVEAVEQALRLVGIPLRARSMGLAIIQEAA